MNRNCVLFSGEGARGSYQAALYRKLRKAGTIQEPDMLMGISSGALNSTALAYQDPDWLVNEWNKITKLSHVFKFSIPKLLWGSGAFDPTPAKNIIRRAVKNRRAHTALGFSVIDIRTGEPTDEVIELNETVVPSVVEAAVAIPGIVHNNGV